MTESLLTLAERVANTARRIDELLTQMRAELEAQEQRSIQRRDELLAEADKLEATIRSIT